MGNSKRTLYKQLYSQTAVTANFTTAVTDTAGCDNLSYEIIWVNGSGLPAGYFTVQGCDEGNILPNGTNQNMTMQPLTLSGVPTITTASGQHMIALNQIPFRFVQLVYTANSGGQADITVNVYGKEL